MEAGYVDLQQSKPNETDAHYKVIKMEKEYF